jgi:hypothetical protein
MFIFCPPSRHYEIGHICAAKRGVKPHLRLTSQKEYVYRVWR